MTITLNGSTGINTPGVVNTAAETIATTLAVTGVTTIAAGAAATPALVGTTGGATTGIFFPAASTVAFANAGVESARINSSGDLLVGTTTTGANGKLEVRNNTGIVAYFYNNAGTGLYLGAGGTSWTTASDERTKTTLTPFQNAAAKVLTLRAGTGRYLADESTVSRSFLIAQDVQAVLPEAVTVRDDEIGTLGLAYTDVIPLLVAAIQEQQALITSLTTRLTALENK